MEFKRNYKLRLKDEEKMSSLALENPKMMVAEDHPQFTPKYLEKIGIDYDADVVGKGYIKLSWSDFIVEEITGSNKIINVEAHEEEHFEEMNVEKPKTEVDLVKQGMATFEVAERFAEALNIPIGDISYAGLKDSKALTSQEFSFNGLRPRDLEKVVIPNVFMKNIHQRKGIVERGSLNGNRFMIHIRTDEIDEEKMERKIEEMNKDGFYNYNFYSLQRFGTRMMSHEIGKLILQGNYEEAVKMFLVGQSPHELKIFKNIRRNAAQYYGDWDQMFEIFSYFPYFFYHELSVLDALRNDGENYAKALSSIEEQVRMMAYAYFSYWFNKLLSYLINNNMEVPEELPLLRPRDDIKEMYRLVMPISEMNSIKFHHPELLLLNLNRFANVSTKIKPQIWSVTKTPCGYVFHFDLDKGSYATTMLADIFHLYQGKPVPEWVSDEKVDAKALLGYEPILHTEMRFPNSEEVKTDLELE